MILVKKQLVKRNVNNKPTKSLLLESNFQHNDVNWNTDLRNSFLHIANKCMSITWFNIMILYT